MHARARVVIAGGGVAGLEAALALRELARVEASVELLTPESTFVYRPASVAEPFGLGESRRFDLAEVAQAAGASLTLGSLVAIDAIRRELHTSAGAVLDYEALLIACGAMQKVALPGALTFRGPADSDAYRALLGEIERGNVRNVAFVVPWGPVWVLPLYELALMTAARVRGGGIRGVELALVTPEDEPLELFGETASAAVRDLLDEREVTLHTRACASAVAGGRLHLLASGSLPADRVVALPRLHGRPIGGVPQTVEGFIPVDSHGRTSLENVCAAGDITDFPVKQGGIASQQAIAAAETIAGWAGAEVDPKPFQPVLRGLLLTGGRPRYLRHDTAEGRASDWATETPLWWPPSKIVGRRLAPFLAALAGVETPVEEAAVEGALGIDEEIGSSTIALLTERNRQPWSGAAEPAMPMRRGTVGDVMSREPLIVAPEDTIGEVAEKMSALGVGSALVADYGNLIGILTARDLLHVLAGRVYSSEARVRQWMTAQPIAVDEDTTLENAALLMTEHGIHHLAVVDGNRPTGMIGLRDTAQ